MERTPSFAMDHLARAVTRWEPGLVSGSKAREMFDADPEEWGVGDPLVVTAWRSETDRATAVRAVVRALAEAERWDDADRLLPGAMRMHAAQRELRYPGSSSFSYRSAGWAPVEKRGNLVPAPGQRDAMAELAVIAGRVASQRRDPKTAVARFRYAARTASDAALRFEATARLGDALATAGKLRTARRTWRSLDAVATELQAAGRAIPPLPGREAAMTALEQQARAGRSAALPGVGRGIG